jgi:hypothetical protein
MTLEPAIAEATKLDPEAKRKILELMRSPDIEQIRDWMHNGKNGYCVVGIVCEAYRRATGRGKWIWEKTPWKSATYAEAQIKGLVERWNFSAEATIAGTRAVTSWMGMDPRKMHVVHLGVKWDLVTLSYRTDFKTIADLIEAQF